MRVNGIVQMAFLQWQRSLPPNWDMHSNRRKARTGKRGEPNRAGLDPREAGRSVNLGDANSNTPTSDVHRGDIGSEMVRRRTKSPCYRGGNKA